MVKDEDRTMKKIIKNGIVVTMNPAGDVWNHGYVIFEGTKILAAGPEDELEKKLQEMTAQGNFKAGEEFEEIDAKRAIVIPGLVNTHSHLGMVPFRGLGDDCKDRLRVFLLPMENQAMDAEMAKLSTRYAIGELLLSGARAEHLRSLLFKLSEAGIHIKDTPGGLMVFGRAKQPFEIRTMVYPGFPTDLQQPMSALLCTATGTSTVVENIFESRFRHLSEMERMGARVRIYEQTAVIEGVPQLHGAAVEATDLRAGAALVIAGLMAQGTTEIYNTHFIDRGYEHLEEKLKEMEKRRSETRRARQKNNVPVVALVGYTNVGKSSLLNALCGEQIFEADMLFATLDPTARKLVLPSGLQIILVDTVGFVSRLPHHLVEAFKSTLEEAAFADVIIKVADAGDAQAAEQLAVTDEVLSSLDCEGIPQLVVYNKCDVANAVAFDPDILLTSAKTGYGLPGLRPPGGKDPRGELFLPPFEVSGLAD